MRAKILILALLCGIVLVYAKPKSERAKAVFHVEITCDNCVKNIQNNIVWEKGLKDMQIDKQAETVTLTWDPQKTDTTTLKQAFEKIHKPVQRIDMVK
ncbi:MAG: heavy-metal-associated domain-containing protein [Paludibacteraceae bacterium]|nr:heavy-metal-associated domain-containing protein [Paludibacteraceae bacterium]